MRLESGRSQREVLSFTQHWTTNYPRYAKLERPIIFVYGINESVNDLSRDKGKA
jgi:hypothetical protein